MINTLIKKAFAIEGFGEVAPPSWLPSKYTSTNGQGLFTFISIFLSLATIIAGIYLIIQLITAGYLYLSANGDPKKIEIAGNKIWQSMIGLLIVAGAVTLASVIARIIGINLLNFEF